MHPLLDTPGKNVVSLCHRCQKIKWLIFFFECGQCSLCFNFLSKRVINALVRSKYISGPSRIPTKLHQDRLNRCWIHCCSGGQLCFSSICLTVFTHYICLKDCSWVFQATYLNYMLHLLNRTHNLWDFFFSKKKCFCLLQLKKKYVNLSITLLTLLRKLQQQLLVFHVKQ